MGRFVTTTTSATLTTCYQVTCHKYSYDANSCWQNKIVIDTPGNYTFTIPAGTSCFRAIAVGGGGKSYVNCNCCGTAGGGGGYAERQDTVNAGCTVTIVVGRQQQDTTISYTNSSSTVRTLTGGGAVKVPVFYNGAAWVSH